MWMDTANLVEFFVTELFKNLLQDYHRHLRHSLDTWFVFGWGKAGADRAGTSIALASGESEWRCGIATIEFLK